MFRLGPDREILGIYFQRRLLLAGAHAAGPRHPCRVRPVEIGDRQIVGARAAGAARHGDDGSPGMTRSSDHAVIASQRVGAKRRTMTGSAMQSRARLRLWIASSLSPLAMTTETV